MPTTLRRQPRLASFVERITGSIAGKTRLRGKDGAAWSARRRGVGSVALVGAGPGAPDLITMRGLARLRAAEVVLYDRLVDPALLEETIKTAELIFVGKVPRRTSWSQDEINALLVERALTGARVVRLKCGDPGVFGRAAEEIAAVAGHGIPLEVVPGVTAASGAAAELGLSLTERGISDTLVISTGQMRDGAADPDWARHVRPGATLVLYMAVGRARTVQRTLLDCGLAPGLEVLISESATTRGSRVTRCRLGTLADDMTRHRISNPAILMIRSQIVPEPSTVLHRDLPVGT